MILVTCNKESQLHLLGGKKGGEKGLKKRKKKRKKAGMESLSILLVLLAAASVGTTYL